MFPCRSIASPSGLAQAVPARGGPNVEIVPTGGFARAAVPKNRQLATRIEVRSTDRDRVMGQLLVEGSPLFSRLKRPLKAQLGRVRNFFAAGGCGPDANPGKRIGSRGHRRCR